MPSKFLIGRLTDGLLVRIVGQATMQESPAFRAAVEPSLDMGIVVFDATQCDYLDSTFLGCLIGIKKTCEFYPPLSPQLSPPLSPQLSPPRRFVIAACNATRVKLFSTSSLDRYFDFVDPCPEPLGQFVAIDIEKVAPKELGQHVMRCHQRLVDMGGPHAMEFKAVADQLAKELDEKA
jgi:hypothetical protein